MTTHGETERGLMLGEILKAHRVEMLGPWTAKCHACDDWTEGTIHDHHANLAREFFAAERSAAVEEALRAAMQRVLETRNEDEDGWGISQGMTNAASVVALCIVEHAEAAGALRAVPPADLEDGGV